MPIFTDAPRDWPAVDLAGLGENHHLNAVNIAKELTDQFNRDNKYRVSSFLESIFLDQGILQSHITVNSSNIKYYLFFFNNNEEMSSRFYSGIRYLFSNSENIESVCYSNFELNPEASPAIPLRQFGPDLLTKLGKSTPEGSYLVWRRELDNEKFSNTEEFKLISDFQNISDGIHSYLLAEILRSLKDIEDNVGRIELPEDEYSVGLIGPENKPFILSASLKKGIIFHFHENRVTSRYRRLFWKHFNTYVKELKDYIIQNGIELDNYSFKSPKAFWEENVSIIKEKEANGEYSDSFGVF